MGMRERKRREDREERERFNRAGAMPHRKHAGNSRLDARLESPLGRLFFSGTITEPQYDAGKRYLAIATRFFETIDAPEPFGGYLASIEDDDCFRRNIIYSQARMVLNAAGKACTKAVDRFVIHEEEPSGEFEIAALCRGLAALCGDHIIPLLNSTSRNLAAA